MRHRALLTLPSLMLIAADTKDMVRIGTPSSGEGMEIYALVVGVSDFQNLPEDLDLRYAEADAQLFTDTLIDRMGGALHAKNVRLLLGPDATKKAISEGLDAALGQADYDDVVLIYFSTHGLLKNGEGYLLTWDSQPEEQLAYTAVAVRDVQELIDRTRAQHVLMFTDACHAATVGYDGSKGAPVNEINQVIGSMRASQGSFFNMSSSLVRQESLEGPEWCGGHGAFTCALTQAMSGEADQDQDGAVSLAELAIRVPAMVYKDTETQQLPEVKGNYDHAMVVSLGLPGVFAPEYVPAPLPLPVGPPARSTAWMRPAGFSMTAAGGAALIGAAVIGGLTLGRYQAFNDDDLTEFDQDEELSDSAARLDAISGRVNLAYGLAGAGVVLGLGGGVLIWRGSF